jgi:hypothetical protein
MKKPQFSEEQMVKILREADAAPVTATQPHINTKGATYRRQSTAVPTSCRPVGRITRRTLRPVDRRAAGSMQRGHELHRQRPHNLPRHLTG